MSRRYYSSYCDGQLEISGFPYVQGPQVVCDSGVPQFVDDMFNTRDCIETVAIESKDAKGRWSSVIYRKMKDEEEQDETRDN